jgi:hypothetical protein
MHRALRTHKRKTMATISILKHASFRCTEGSSDKVYHLQLIATSGGYQVLAQHGRRGATLRCIQKTDAHVSFRTADLAWAKAIADRSDHQYASIPPAVPDVEPYAPPNDYEIVKDISEFVAKHNTLNVPDPTRPARVDRRNKELAAQLGKLLAHPLATISDGNAPTVSVTKNGGDIRTNVTDPEALRIARAAALEIGGAITLDGYIEDGIFFITRASGTDLDRLLARARPSVVRRAASKETDKVTTMLFAEFMADESRNELHIVDAAGVLRTFPRADVVAALPHLPEFYKEPIAS